MLFRKYIVLLAVAGCCLGCSKSKSDKDKQPPVITITSPLNNAVFTAGQTINVMATAIDNDEVTELHIHVIDKATGNLLRDIHSYPAQATGFVTDSFPASASITYTIQIIAKDPAQNTGTISVEVSVN